MIKDYKRLVDKIIKEMRLQAESAGTNKAEIDISGGVDSAVVAALSCLAFKPENVIGVFSDINSSPEAFSRARMVADKFCFKMVELGLTGVYNIIVNAVKQEFERLGIPWIDEEHNLTAFGGLRSCLRAPVGRFVNRIFGGGIRQGTGNRDEDELLRFYQKGGDGEVDCNWIGSLFKGEVWELAAHLGVPDEIINAKPTPDLWGNGNNHSDEDELESTMGVPMTYTRPGKSMGTIEWIIRQNDGNGIINGYSSQSINGMTKNLFTKDQWKIVEAVRKMEIITRHKTMMPPKIPRKELKELELVD
jgi:NAD+ synthetase